MFILCLSHRARNKIELAIGKRSHYYSFSRPSNYGIVNATNDEVATLRNLPRRIPGWRVLHPPYDDIHECISMAPSERNP